MCRYTVEYRPTFVIFSTGDELVQPTTATLNHDQVISTFYATKVVNYGSDLFPYTRSAFWFACPQFNLYFAGRVGCLEDLIMSSSHHLFS
jgi:hypothetical protein